MPKADADETAENGALLPWEKGLVDALPPGPNTDPVLAGTLVEALPPGPKTDPVGFTLGVEVEALPPGPKTDPVEFWFANTEPPKADPAAPNTEGCPNVDVVVVAGVPKTDVVAVGALPKAD